MKMLRKIRKEKGLTMKQLGAIVGVTEAAISQYETGKREADFETLLKISEALDCTVDYLLGREIQKEKPLVNEDEELTEYLDELKNRPEMKMLFSLAKGATKEDVEKAVKIIETLLGK